MTFFDVVIIGGGASGLFCAFTAGRRGRKVLVIDHNSRLGRKILLSGGGRCNFTNLFLEPNHFISSNPHFCKSALKRFSQWDFIAMVEKYGIEYHERENGQLFCNDSSAPILDMLLSECKKAGVTFLTETRISEIKVISGTPSNDKRFLLKTGINEVETTSLVISTGGQSYLDLGSNNYGYEVARKFGLNVLPTKPALVPLIVNEGNNSMCTRLSGISLDVKMEIQGMEFTGALLFTHRGMSGPVVLQASNYWEQGKCIRVNLLPGMDVESWLLLQKETQPQKLLRGILSNSLPKKLVAELQTLFWQSWGENSIRSIPDSFLKELSHKLTDWRIIPKKSEGFKKAEATLGGVDTACLSSKSMESTKQPGLYFVGEVVDVTGQLGGFNLQWAWSSGFAAGQFV